MKLGPAHLRGGHHVEILSQRPFLTTPPPPLVNVYEYLVGGVNAYHTLSVVMTPRKWIPQCNTLATHTATHATMHTAIHTRIGDFSREVRNVFS